MTGVRGGPNSKANFPRSDAGGSAGPLNVVIGLEGLALGGCPINALDLGRTLRDRGHRVHVFAIDEDVRVSLIPYAQRSGFEVTLLPSNAGVASRARHIRRFADSHDADVVHVFAPWLGSSASVAAASLRPRVAIVTNWMMSNVTYTPRHMPLIVGTKQMQQEAKAFHGSRVWLMEPPVDILGEVAGAAGAEAFRHEHGIAAEETVAMIVSRIDKHMKAEGIGYAIDAVSQLEDPRLRLVVVGDGDAFKDISGLAETVNQRLGRDAVVMTGSMYDPRPAYAASDIMLGMGGSALRSLAHGKPLIVLGEQGFSRTFEPGTIDYFLTFGFYGDDAQERPAEHLALEIRDLLDPARRRELGRFGEAQVRSRFGLDVTAESLERIYRAELGDSAGALRRTMASASTLTQAIGHQTKRSLTGHLRSLTSGRA